VNAKAQPEAPAASQPPLPESYTYRADGRRNIYEMTQQ